MVLHLGLALERWGRDEFQLSHRLIRWHDSGVGLWCLCVRVVGSVRYTTGKVRSLIDYTSVRVFRIRDIQRRCEAEGWTVDPTRMVPTACREGRFITGMLRGAFLPLHFQCCVPWPVAGVCVGSPNLPSPCLCFHPCQVATTCCAMTNLRGWTFSWRGESVSATGTWPLIILC
jgi:hypothetical protein